MVRLRICGAFGVASAGTAAIVDNTPTDSTLQLAYMDVGLSTDLNALLPLVAPLVSGHSDLAIGSRLTRSSRVVREPKREFISRSHNLMLRTAMGASFSDAPCGFKAIPRRWARRLLPMVDDTGWFFDTEMLVIEQRAGLRIAEIPVDWTDDPAGKVDIVKTATEDIKGCCASAGHWPAVVCRSQTSARALDAMRPGRR